VPYQPTLELTVCSIVVRIGNNSLFDLAAITGLTQTAYTDVWCLYGIYKQQENIVQCSVRHAEIIVHHNSDIPVQYINSSSSFTTSLVYRLHPNIYSVGFWGFPPMPILLAPPVQMPGYATSCRTIEILLIIINEDESNWAIVQRLQRCIDFYTCCVSSGH